MALGPVQMEPAEGVYYRQSIILESSESMSVGCSKQGYCVADSLPAGSIRLTNEPVGALHPASLLGGEFWGKKGFSAANKSLDAVGVEVPAMMN